MVHPPVHKTLVLRALDTIFPKDIKCKIMPYIFPVVKVDRTFLDERLTKCSAKRMKRTPGAIHGVRDDDLIPFLLEKKSSFDHFT